MDSRKKIVQEVYYKTKEELAETRGGERMIWLLANCFAEFKKKVGSHYDDNIRQDYEHRIAVNTMGEIFDGISLIISDVSRDNTALQEQLKKEMKKNFKELNEIR